MIKAEIALERIKNGKCPIHNRNIIGVNKLHLDDLVSQIKQDAKRMDIIDDDFIVIKDDTNIDEFLNGYGYCPSDKCNLMFTVHKENNKVTMINDFLNTTKDPVFNGDRQERAEYVNLRMGE